MGRKSTEKIGVRVVATCHYRRAQVALHSFFLFRIYRYLPLIASLSGRVDHGSIGARTIPAIQRDIKRFVWCKAFTTRTLLRTNCAHSSAFGLFGRLYQRCLFGNTEETSLNICACKRTFYRNKLAKEFSQIFQEVEQVFISSIIYP